MASISLTDPVAATTVTAGLHAGNNAALRTAINGGLDNTNVAAAGVANIDLTKLAATAWTAYTPTWGCASGAAPVLNNGTIAGRYQQIGKTVTVSFAWTAGAATTFGGGVFIFSVPVAPHASSNLLGVVTIVDTSAGSRYPGFTVLNAGSNLAIGTTASPQAFATATVPFTFATTDTINGQVTYEAA